MDKQYKKYIYILSSTQIVIFTVIAFILIFLSHNIASHNNDILQMVVLKDAEKNMRKVVDNTIVRIDIQRKMAYNQVEKTINLAVALLSATDEQKPYENAQKILKDIHQLEYGAPLNMIIYNQKSKTSNLFSNNPDTQKISPEKNETHPTLLNGSKFQNSLMIGDYHIHFFANESDIEAIVKNYVYNEIHSSKYNENEYIWINEILNYEGGENYALRIVHPNLKHTEGTPLSTNTRDTKGNLPYLKELKGIKENGEILQTYYFKNKMDDQTTQKISYAKLYEPYNWVIATGEPMEDIFIYTNELKEYDKRAVKKSLYFALGLIIFIFLMGGFIIYKVHKSYRKNIETYVRTETELDALTGAFSRKSGTLKIEEHFSQFKDHMPSPFLMMLDIDNFKKINDTYGHDVGDIVLKKVSQAIQSNVRNSDFLFRWGGEEFILLCNTIDLNKHYQLAQKILRCVNAISFETDKECFNVTVSIGGACFYKEDDHYTQAIKRSDMALYQSKNTGKNKYTSSFESMKEA